MTDRGSQATFLVCAQKLNETPDARACCWLSSPNGEWETWRRNAPSPSSRTPANVPCGWSDTLEPAEPLLIWRWYSESAAEFFKARLNCGRLARGQVKGRFVDSLNRQRAEAGFVSRLKQLLLCQLLGESHGEVGKQSMSFPRTRESRPSPHVKRTTGFRLALRLAGMTAYLEKIFAFFAPSRFRFFI